MFNKGCCRGSCEAGGEKGRLEDMQRVGVIEDDAKIM